MRQLKRHELYAVAGGIRFPDITSTSIKNWLEDVRRNNWTVTMWRQIGVAIVLPFVQLIQAMSGLFGLGSRSGA